MRIHPLSLMLIRLSHPIHLPTWNTVRPLSIPQPVLPADQASEPQQVVALQAPEGDHVPRQRPVKESHAISDVSIV